MCKLLKENCTLLLVGLLLPVIDQQALCQHLGHFLHSVITAVDAVELFMLSLGIAHCQIHQGVPCTHILLSTKE